MWNERAVRPRVKRFTIEQTLDKDWREAGLFLCGQPQTATEPKRRTEGTTDSQAFAGLLCLSAS